MDKRDELSQYNRQRLTFEGVLVDVIQPNSRNGYTYGLVFGSIYAIHKHFQIDHVVIKMSALDYSKTELNLFKRYVFSAEVAKYEKVGLVLGVFALRERYMIQNINTYKIQEEEESATEQPTKYVMQRVNNILESPGNTHDENELIQSILSEPNDGSVERLLDVYTKSLQRKPINDTEMIRILY